LRYGILFAIALALAILAMSGLWTLSLLPRAKPEAPPAVVAGSLEGLRGTLSLGEEMDGKDTRGFTALDWAARAGQTEAIAELTRAGADPDFRDSGPNGWTPLLHAVHKNQLGSVRALIAAGAGPNERGENGLTPLMLAAAQGEPEIVEELLKAGANPRLRGPLRWTALEQAVTGGNPRVVEALMRKDPGLSLGHGPRGWTLRTLARLAGHSEALKRIDRGEGR
jgi:ankyrin repeat protein